MALAIAWRRKLMFHNLRIHFTKLYVCTTGAFFLCVLLGGFLLFSNQINTKAKEELLSQMNLVKNYLLDNSSISHRWIANFEHKNGLILSIEDNGIPLLYEGTSDFKTPRATLIKKMETIAEQNGLTLHSYPLFSESEEPLAPIFISGEHGERFYGSAFMVLHTDSWQSVILLKDITKLQTQKLFFLFLLLGIGIIGISLFYWISYHITGKMLQPLEENYKKQTDFIAAASHELKSPLAVIRTSISEVRKEVTKEGLHPLSIMDSETVRMARLIDDLLLLASSNTHTWNLTQERIDTDSLLIDTFDSFEGLFHNNNRTLILSLPEDPLPVINGDKIRCSQILSILLDNALTYTPESSTVILSGKRSTMPKETLSLPKLSYTKKHSTPALVLFVSDNGNGISKEQQPLIFDRFYQTDASHTKKDHFGLGLSIAKELMELHHGELRYCTSESGGACFECYFPLEC